LTFLSFATKIIAVVVVVVVVVVEVVVVASHWRTFSLTELAFSLARYRYRRPSLLLQRTGALLLRGGCRVQ